MYKTLALFDFDGTITSKDTLFDMAKYATSSVIYGLKIGALLPLFVLMKLSLLSKKKGKELFLKVFFAGMSMEDFQSLCNEYCQKRLPEIIRPLAMKEIMAFRDASVDIFIVSASPRNWIEPWATALGIKVLSTNLHFENGNLTGKIEGNNCNGQEKVNRIKNNINLASYDSIIAYGDTSGDLPMFELANKTHYKPFI